MLKDGKRLSVIFDETNHNPRKYKSNLWKLCIHEHNRYVFDNELNSDFNSIYILEVKYYIFYLKLHNSHKTTFNIDTDINQADWFIAIPKEYNSYDLCVRGDSLNQDKWEKIVLSRKEALDIAEEEIKIYNAYINWEVFGVIIEKQIKRTSERGDVKTTRECVEWCWWFYEMDDILDMYADRKPVEIE